MKDLLLRRLKIFKEVLFEPLVFSDAGNRDSVTSRLDHWRRPRDRMAERIGPLRPNSAKKAAFV